LGAGAPVRMASIEAGHGILRFYHAARQRTHGERIGGQTVRPHKCSRIRSGHPEHLDRSALPNATANPQRPHHHERPRQQHFCPVMDATCSQNQTASSTQLSSFCTSFAHPLSFTYSSPGKVPPRKRKIIADLLSRFLLAPSWGSVIEQTSPTLDCSKPCRGPRALLSQLVRLLRSDANEEMSATAMMQLWTLELEFLHNGWRTSPLVTSLSGRSHRGKRSHS